jgi:hypothetical protein
MTPKRNAVMTCPNGHPLLWSEQMHWWWPCGKPGCDFPDAKPISYEYAAAHRLGPFAPKRNEYERAHIPGYVQIGPTTYERIGPGTDFRDVWQDGLRAVRALAKKGEW